MSGERVPQRMWRNGFRDAAALACKLACVAHGMAGDGPPRNAAWKEPFLRMGVLPVQSQDLEQPGREHYIAILTVLPLVHTDHHALAVDIGDLQMHDFGDTQSGGVRGHQDGAVLEAGDRLEEGGDLLQAEDDWQSERLLR